MASTPTPPTPHPSGERAPQIPSDQLPRHVAIVMDGNGRWAQARGLPRTKGHEVGEEALSDVVRGAVELGLENLSVYAFSTENWRRPASEVRFLMGYSREAIRRQRDTLHDMGVRIVWAGSRGRLWPSVISELEKAVELTKDNSVMTFQMCVNYGSRAEITDAARSIARRVATEGLDPDSITEDMLGSLLYHPDIPDVDLFIRSSGEQRISNFLLWQCAYAELIFVDKLWPDWDRRDLWEAVLKYLSRDRRFGGVNK